MLLCPSVCVDTNVDAAYECLGQQISVFQEQGEVIVMGDFNARTGLTEHNHDVGVNSSGPWLCNLVAQHTLEFLNLPVGVPPSLTYKVILALLLTIFLFLGHLPPMRGPNKLQCLTAWGQTTTQCV